MTRQFRFAAAPLIAAAMIAGSTATALAFSQQILTPNGNYNFNYGPLDDKPKSDDSTNKSDPNSPGFHFSIERGQTDQFGFRSLGGSSNTGTPDYYGRPLGNGN